jgi:hypothetical protein
MDAALLGGGRDAGSGRWSSYSLGAATGPTAQSMPSALSSTDLRIVEVVLRMEEGYVCNFTDRRFAEFFEDFDVDIGDPRYCEDGTSKAKRLRRFLRSADSDLTGRVLKALLDYRQVSIPDPLREQDLDAYQKVVERLTTPANPPAPKPAASEQDNLLQRAFEPALFTDLPLDRRMTEVITSRMAEAQKCLQAGAYLATVILCGSVLEGMCEGFGKRNADEVKRGFRDRFNRQPPRLEDWKLVEWILVLAQLGHLSPTIEKFSHSLREFRNYVHPGAELRNGFSLDHHSAAIGFQVVLAAASDLTRASTKQKHQDHG